MPSPPLLCTLPPEPGRSKLFLSIFCNTQARLRRLQQSLTKKDEALEQRNREIKQMRIQRRKFADNHDYNEARTRELLIDVMLLEAGWDPAEHSVREYKISGMPNKTGTGYVDYVLWNDNGKPLALVEAKRTTRSYDEGLHQAKLYADSLQREFDVRPVIFVSNGYEIWIWDDEQYPPRKILGFYTKDSLQTLFFHRKERRTLKLAKVNKNITDRYYQIAAIRRVGERFEEGHRRALLVMATGTGKTRTAISLTDVLLKNKWVKRALFLADRNALVRQAYKNFAVHLPDVPIVNLVEEKNDIAARIVFSTYPTILNQIENLEEGKRKFDPGYFDLVIIDEAHRSVYNKYQAIFDYFDSLLLGLTATPKEDVDRDTYELFDSEQGNPTYAYGLDEAVADGNLVPPKKVRVEGNLLTHGVTYSELSEEEKKVYDNLIKDTDLESGPGYVDPQKINAFLFNEDTVEKVLMQLMEYGIKVEGGDRLGDTIIFAKNQRHAKFIRETFDKIYPAYAGKFAQVIHNEVEYAQDLIEDFCYPKKMPVIAISVDMMDTGIDAPDCVNLVFFKPVRSKAKFNQMIGRGTRLRPDLFGPGKHKKHFLVFDYCGNFEFFEENPEGYETSAGASITARIFEKRLELTSKLTNEPFNQIEDLQAYREELLNVLHQQVSNLNEQSIQVRPHLKLVHRLKERVVWEHLQSNERSEIVRKLAQIIPPNLDEDERTRRYDLLMLNLQHEVLDGVLEKSNLKENAISIAEQLYHKKHIPAVENVLPYIQQSISESFWKSPDPVNLDEIRANLRGLMHLVDAKDKTIAFTDFEDTLSLPDFEITGTNEPVINKDRYLRKIRSFIKEHKNHLVIEKIRNAKPLTDDDIKGLEKFLMESDPDISPEEFYEIVGKDLKLVEFVRCVSGLEREAVVKEFDQFLQDNQLSSIQIQFIEQMIEFYTEKGHLKVANLYEPPFNFIDEDGVEGAFANKTKVIELLVEKVRKLNKIKVS
ncbi:MAG TPA: DEAD/DEAH box helicase family protein [Balneolaceae bacterium]|nr:DEAD/DEAH box helicase family protein [Balneolaceae bacterium]